ncbi:hypothetical protein FACS1894216_20230 [Synergistales bacterium]|nr:hypothetical protein FACS1894216_20230 [Synergistales bacterium]
MTYKVDKINIGTLINSIPKIILVILGKFNKASVSLTGFPV